MKRVERQQGEEGDMHICAAALIIRKNWEQGKREKERMGFGAERSSDPLPSACARGGVVCLISVSQVLLHLLRCMVDCGSGVYASNPQTVMTIKLPRRAWQRTARLCLRWQESLCFSSRLLDFNNDRKRWLGTSRLLLEERCHDFILEPKHPHRELFKLQSDTEYSWKAVGDVVETQASFSNSKGLHIINPLSPEYVTVQAQSHKIKHSPNHSHEISVHYKHANTINRVCSLATVPVLLQESCLTDAFYIISSRWAVPLN